MGIFSRKEPVPQQPLTTSAQLSYLSEEQSQPPLPPKKEEIEEYREPTFEEDNEEDAYEEETEKDSQYLNAMKNFSREADKKKIKSFNDEDLDGQLEMLEKEREKILLRKEEMEKQKQLAMAQKEIGEENIVYKPVYLTEGEFLRAIMQGQDNIGERLNQIEEWAKDITLYLKKKGL